MAYYGSHRPTTGGITPIAAVTNNYGVSKPRVPFGDVRTTVNLDRVVQPMRTSTSKVANLDEKPQLAFPTKERISRKPMDDAPEKRAPGFTGLDPALKAAPIPHAPVPPNGAEPAPKEKVRPPSPPNVIRDTSNTLTFQKVGFLGEGGFARVYEVKDQRGKRHALKCVYKDALQTKKAKTKLWAEIKIHKSLQHPNIVGFEHCFEDDENVYMSLELCENGSLMDVLRRRKRFTEPEARYYLVQLIGACLWMHTHQVIHRDLKLGNIFLDRDMNIKVGDFGLAALIENPGDRKKTICGTPNYIAPEVLFDRKNGHSFEVDTWSIGVILYTLLIGKPPFQTKEVNAIYKRIRDNEYEFPADRPISPDAKALITSMLTTDPQKRPGLREVIDHPFFTRGTIPSSIPIRANDTAPDFRHISSATSRANLEMLKQAVLLSEMEEISDSEDPAQQAAASMSMALGTSFAQQEREFQKAVQPNSPISVLLKSAQQPLLSAAAATRAESGSLIKKLAGSRSDPPSIASSLGASTLRRPTTTTTAPLRNIEEEHEADRSAPLAFVKGHRAAADQKYRIIREMAVSPVEPQAPTPTTVAPPPRPPSAASAAPSTASKLALKKSISSIPKATEPVVVAAPATSSKNATVNPKVNSFDVIEQTITEALEARAAGEAYYPAEPLDDLVDFPNFIVAWVDYCNKYGMGYTLSDGTVGVHFNDSTSLIISPSKQHMDYIETRRQGTVYVRKNYEATARPETLSEKAYLLGHFKQYMEDRLTGDQPYLWTDESRKRGMDFVLKYLRTKYVIVFKMSHDVVQFNFIHDHTKIILSQTGLMVTYLDKHNALQQFLLVDLMDPTLDAAELELDEAVRKKLVHKVKHCRDVLKLIRTGEVPAFSSNANKDEGEKKQKEPTTEKTALKASTASKAPEASTKSEIPGRLLQRQKSTSSTSGIPTSTKSSKIAVSTSSLRRYRTQS